MTIIISFLISNMCWFVCFFGGTNKEISAKNIIKNVQKKYESITDLSADFVQQFEWKLAETTDYYNGKLYIKKVNKFRLETEDQVIVTDGVLIWSYYILNNQVVIDKLDNSENAILPKEYLFEYPKNRKASLAGEEKKGDNHYYILKLTPKDEDTFEISTKAWINSKTWITEKVETIDINDNVRTIQVSNIILNQNLGDDQFSFVIPDSTEVIDMR